MVSKNGIDLLAKENFVFGLLQNDFSAWIILQNWSGVLMQ
jgi:hypothetical protein